jgi:hypothetical protein
MQSGRSIPVSAVALQANGYRVLAAVDGYTIDQVLPLENIDHVFGDKPPELNQGIALLLMDKPAEALKLLDPIVTSQRITSKIPGNFWLEAARASLVAYAVSGNTAKCNDIGKEISDATPNLGIDPFVMLGKALMLPPSTKDSERIMAFRDLMSNSMAADVSAYASIYLGNFLKTVKRNPDAALATKQNSEILEAYLMVPCIFPSGGIVLNGFAELKAAELLANLNRRLEAVALLQSSTRNAADTLVATEANKRLESLKD